MERLKGVRIGFQYLNGVIGLMRDVSVNLCSVYMGSLIKLYMAKKCFGWKFFLSVS